VELKVSVSEALALIKEIEHVPAKLFEYIGMSVQKEVGSFLSNLMGKELTDHIGREKYERKNGATDYRNGSYTRTFCIKGIGDVEVRVPRDRDGDVQSQVLPRAQRYDERITEDLAAMYLTGISNRAIALGDGSEQCNGRAEAVGRDLEDTRSLRGEDQVPLY